MLFMIGTDCLNVVYLLDSFMLFSPDDATQRSSEISTILICVYLIFM